MRPDSGDGEKDEDDDRCAPEALEREEATRSVTLLVTNEEFERIGREYCEQTLAIFSPSQYAAIGRKVLVSIGSWYLYFMRRGCALSTAASHRGTETAKRQTLNADNNDQISHEETLQPPEATLLIN